MTRLIITVRNYHNFEPKILHQLLRQFLLKVVYLFKLMMMNAHCQIIRSIIIIDLSFYLNTFLHTLIDTFVVFSFMIHQVLKNLFFIISVKDFIIKLKLELAKQYIDLLPRYYSYLILINFNLTY